MILADLGIDHGAHGKLGSGPKQRADTAASAPPFPPLIPPPKVAFCKEPGRLAERKMNPRNHAFAGANPLAVQV